MKVSVAGTLQRSLTATARASQDFSKFDAIRSYQDRAKSGQPRAATEAQDNMLEKIALENRKKSASELNKEWRKATRNCIQIATRTVNTRLLLMGLPARTPQMKLLKMEQMKEKRLRFAKYYQNWTAKDWEKICFSDETWMQVRENGCLQFVRRRPG